MFLTLIVLVGILLISSAITRSPRLALPLLLLVELGNAANYSGVILIGRFHIYPGDLLTVSLFIAAIVRWGQQSEKHRPTKILMVFTGLVLIGFLLGAKKFGVQTSVVADRQILAMCATAIFFSTVSVTSAFVKTIRNWFLIASAVVAAVALRFWVVHGLGTYATTGTRAIDALAALVVLESIILVIAMPPIRHSSLQFIIPLLGFITVLFSVQRTVWAAGVVGVAVFVLIGKKKQGALSTVARRGLAVVGLLSIILLVAAGPSSVSTSLSAGIQKTSATQSSTFSWRLQGWSQLISRQVHGSPIYLLIGSPSGTGSDRSINGEIVTVSPHSEYVLALESTGIIGTFSLLAICAGLLKKLKRRLRSQSLDDSQLATLCMVLLATQLTFFIAYSAGLIAGLTLGLSLGFVKRRDAMRELLIENHEGDSQLGTGLDHLRF